MDILEATPSDHARLFNTTRALKQGGHTPHLLEEAFSWYDAFCKHGTMKGCWCETEGTRSCQSLTEI